MIYKAPSVDTEPASGMFNWELILISWGVEVAKYVEDTPEQKLVKEFCGDNKHSIHLVGIESRGGSRMCSPIISLSIDAMTAVTRSGRFYGIYGDPGLTSMGESMLEQWIYINGNPEYRIVTQEIFDFYTKKNAKI